MVLAVFISVLGLGFLAVRYTGATPAGQWLPRSMLAAGAVLILVGVWALPQAISPSYVSDEEAGEILSGLMKNIYGAFDYREESVIYEILERSASGDLLTEIYLETRRSLELANQGGARAKVKSVEMLEASQEPLGTEIGFIAQCKWSVSGSVGHWGTRSPTHQPICSPVRR